LTNKDEITLISTSIDPVVVKNTKFNFLYWLRSEDMVKELRQELIRLDYKKIAIITAQYPGSLQSKNDFEKINTDSKVEILISEEVLPNELDFKPLINRLRKYPDLQGVFVNLNLGQIGIFARQVKESGINLPLFGLDIFEDLNELKTSKGALVGSWYVQISNPTNEFNENYGKRFSEQSIYSAGNCYDAVKLFSEAIAEKKDFNIYLENLKEYQGSLGKVSSSGDHRFVFPTVIKEVTNTGFRVKEH
jgi:ABC-type branched-subunit amino acid transport system substrate-binding protein